MRLYKFEPQKYDGGLLKGFKGHIMLRCPTFEERMGYIEQCGLELDDKGNVKQTSNPVGQIQKMVVMSKAHYQKVEITNAENDEKYKNFDDLSTDPACDSLLSVVGGLVLKGFKPSKNSKAS